jgi:hypothetical protein
MTKDYSILLNDEDQFLFGVDFEKSSGDPSRVFQSMAEITSAVQVFQIKVARVVAGDIDSSLVLSDVEKGSLVAKFFAKILGFDKRINRQEKWDVDFLDLITFSMEAVVEVFSGDEKVVTFDEISAVCEKIEEKAKNIGGALIDVGRLPPSDVVDFGVKMARAASVLSANDDIYFSSREVSLKVSKYIPLDEAQALEILTVKVETKVDPNATLKIKKPDYLGRSKWSVVYMRTGRTIDVKIDHIDWLESFQRNDLGETISPGDCISAVLEVRCGFDRNGEITFEDYVVNNVNDILHGGGSAGQGVLHGV